MATGELEGKTILIVEDSWHLATILQDLLEAEGALIAGPAPNVELASQLIEETAIDLAVVDINLGGEIGLGVLGMLDKRGVRVVVLSGYAEARDLVSRQFETVAVLTKPIAPRELLDALK